MSLTMTEREFAFWLEHSSPTSQVIYHCGSLPRDRSGKHVYDGETVKQIRTIYSQAVDYMAWAAWHAMRRHYVLLTQRRVSESDFEYLATRTGVSFPPISNASVALPKPTFAGSHELQEPSQRLWRRL